MGFECTAGGPCFGTPFEVDLKSGPIRGINCKYYHKNGALCMNSQNFPDACNHVIVSNLEKGNVSDIFYCFRKTFPILF